MAATVEKSAFLDVGHHEKLGRFLEFREAGMANVVVDFMGQSFQVPFNVVRLGINEGDESAAVVNAFGLPDNERRVDVSWPKTETEDRIIYSPKAGEGTIAAKHWRYNAQPGLVMSIVDGHLYEVSSYRERDVLSESDSFDRWMRLGAPTFAP